jgi:hypothetical protein
MKMAAQVNTTWHLAFFTSGLMDRKPIISVDRIGGATISRVQTVGATTIKSTRNDIPRKTRAGMQAC